MDLSKSLEEISKFFNEILGYLLPGLTIIFLTSLFTDPKQTEIKNIFTESNTWLVLFLSYVVGYIVYGLSLSIDKILKKVNFIPKDDENIKANIERNSEYQISKETIVNLIPKINADRLDFHSVRNIAMSYVPEADQKIYTFMFRADLFKHTRDIIILVCVWGLISYLSFWVFNNSLLFNTSGNMIVFVVLLLFLVYPLNEGKKRFLGIAYKIQFGLFLAKCFPIKKEKDGL